MGLASFYKDKVVIVTGASMGIGKELARQVLVNGGKVVITGRNADRLHAAEMELNTFGNAVLSHTGDVTNFDNCKLLIQETLERFGKLDILINNAGLSCYGDVGHIKPEVVKQVIDVNIYGSLFPVMTAIPELVKTRGSLLFVSSLAGLSGLPRYSAYSLSKMALRALAQSLRIELKSKGVFVGIAYPCFVENEEQKQTLNPEGKLEHIPKRPEKLTVTRETTATKILRQIMIRKHSETHTIFGTITDISSRYMPFLLYKILSRNYRKW